MTKQEPYNSLEEYKKRILTSLPFNVDIFTIRELNRQDIDLYVSWPDYPPPYEMFNTSLKNKPLTERDKRWESYCQNNNTLSLVVEYKEEMIGKFSLLEIDWKKMSVNNMSIRLHPQWCNNGNGTKILKGISNWCFDNGIVKIKFDVLSTNQRAVKSYKNIGYKIIDKFEHGNATFYWMELRSE